MMTTTTTTTSSSSSASFQISNVEVINLGKSSNPINTGIGFFDHMIDQLNSHAQVGVSVKVLKTVSGSLSNGNNGSSSSNSSSSNNTNIEDRNHHAHPPELQEELMSLVGTALGTELRKILPSTNAKSRFCCPLDEALVECTLQQHNHVDTNNNGGGANGVANIGGDGSGSLAIFSLAPYGIYPKTKGRSKIGQMMTTPLETFFRSLASSSGLRISLVKQRGDNGHHVVESAFKAFSRALRNFIDGTSIDLDVDDHDHDNGSHGNGNGNGNHMASMWGIQSQSYKEGIEFNRMGKSSRTTKETSIHVELKLDGATSGTSIDCGVNTLNEFYTKFAQSAQLSLHVQCKGDTWVDDHHTSEDVSIAIGKVLNIALGTKAGLNRMWCATATVGEVIVEVTMDLSNRPCITHDLSLSSDSSSQEYVGDLSIEMFDHALESLVMNAQMTVHIVEKKNNRGGNGNGNGDGDECNLQDLVMATAEAFGKCLRLCAAVDPRRAGKTASSKGTLCV